MKSRSMKSSKRISTRWALLAAFALLVPTAADADAKVFRVKDDGGSRASFVSDAPLETITGATSKVIGKVTFDPTNLSSVKGTFKVPVGTLDTGVKLRDEHLHGKNWLDSQKHPFGEFTIKSVSGAKSLKANKETTVTVKGTFKIHGVTKPLTTKAKVRWLPLTDELKATPGITGDVLRVKAKFDIKLTDYNVSVPSIVRLKVSNDITVSVDLRAVAQ